QSSIISQMHIKKIQETQTNFMVETSCKKSVERNKKLEAEVTTDIKSIMGRSKIEL
ncbi:hypothetical protein HK096_010923, partial [Nowakowskiella sp. JEL0078]